MVVNWLPSDATARRYRVAVGSRLVDAPGTDAEIDTPPAADVDDLELDRLESDLADVQSVLDDLSRIPETTSAEDDPAPVIRGLIEDGRFQV